jgi:hypothetical protein
MAVFLEGVMCGSARGQSAPVLLTAWWQQTGQAWRESRQCTAPAQGGFQACISQQTRMIQGQNPNMIAEAAGEDFIEVYEGALDAKVCAALIQRFDASGQAVRGSTGGGVDIALKDSWDIQITGNPQWADAERALNAAMMSGVLRYLRKYPYTVLAPMSLRMPNPSGGAPILLGPTHLAALSDDALQALTRKTFRPGSINLQKYISDQGGYPYWHCELYPKLGDATAQTLHRTLLWTLYLNDAFAEGETEFLHQRRKIKPRTGALLIAPAAFTHTHRGNMPKSGNKYIATSWILFQRAESIYAVK